ncbi:MAG: retropepsin-like aspartic protease [Prolixibacteraceae bacterium]
MIILPLELIELEENNFHLVLESKLGDGRKIFWIVDTGASKTVFDSNLEDCYKLLKNSGQEQYQSAGISVGMVETRVGSIDRIRLGRLKIKNLKVALIDLSHVNEIYRKYRDIQIGGLLGSDVLKDYGCRIDYQAATITFHKK